MQSIACLKNNSISKDFFFNEMKKQEWIDVINSSLENGQAFGISYYEADKASLLFACDVFRRRMYDVRVGMDASENGTGSLNVSISHKQNSLSFTVKREDNGHEILRQLTSPDIECVTIRGCGTVINVVCDVVSRAIHHGWYVENSHLNTLTQKHQNTKQRNTTLLFVLRRGSQLDSI